jgi:hypothetical protein
MDVFWTQIKNEIDAMNPGSHARLCRRQRHFECYGSDSPVSASWQPVCMIRTRGGRLLALCTCWRADVYDYRSPHFPLNRVRKIMKLDGDVKVCTLCSVSRRRRRSHAVAVLACGFPCTASPQTLPPFAVVGALVLPTLRPSSANDRRGGTGCVRKGVRGHDARDHASCVRGGAGEPPPDDSGGCAIALRYACVPTRRRSCVWVVLLQWCTCLVLCMLGL